MDKIDGVKKSPFLQFPGAIIKDLASCVRVGDVLV